MNLKMPTMKESYFKSKEIRGSLIDIQRNEIIEEINKASSKGYMEVDVEYKHIYLEILDELKQNEYKIRYCNSSETILTISWYNNSRKEF